MPIDKSKLIEAANKFLQKGQIDKAIKEFAKIVEVDPRDIRVRIKLGELYARRGMREESVNEYRLVAQEYTKAGFYSKAVAVYKQALKVDMRQVDIYSKLGDLYHKLGLTNEAMTQYKIVANYYDKEGMTKECQETLKKIIGLDPENLSNRVKLAESFYRGNLRKEADEEFGRVIHTLKEQGRANDLITLYERMLATNPKHYGLIKELSKIYLERGDAQRALIKLQMPLKEGVKDRGVLSLLADAYMKLGKGDKAKTALKELARECEEAGENEARQDAYRRILKLDPKDPDALRASGKAAPSPVSEEHLVLEEEVVPEEKVVKEAPRKVKVEAPPEVKAPPKAKPPEVKKDDGLSRYFTEAEIYFKYGLKEKALDQLGQVLKVQPANEQALSKLRELSAAAEERKKVLSIFLALAEEYSGKGGKQDSERFLKEVLKIDPENSQAKKLMGIKAPAKAPVPVEVKEKEPLEIELEVEEPEVEVVTEKEIPSPLEASSRLEDVALEEEPVITIEPEPLQVPMKEPAAREVSREVKADFATDEELDEAEFYIQQGLYDEAKKIYQKILQVHPHDNHVILKLQDLDELEGKVEEVPKVTEPEVVEVIEGATVTDTNEGAEEIFDLAKELEEELAAEEQEQPRVSVEGPEGKEIFEDTLQKFKQGVEKAVAKEDVDTHYDLGIAYKEMGLIHDAIREFEIAISNPKKEINCCTMVGLCYMEKREPKKAIEYYSRALNNPRLTDKEKVGLNYELAVAYEVEGNLGRALAIFGKVGEMEKDFRDVQERLADLKKRASVPPKAEEKRAVPALEEKAAPALEEEAVPALEEETVPASEEEMKKVIPISARRRPGKKISYV